MFAVSATDVDVVFLTALGIRMSWVLGFVAMSPAAMVVLAFMMNVFAWPDRWTVKAMMPSANHGIAEETVAFVCGASCRDCWTRAWPVLAFDADGGSMDVGWDVGILLAVVVTTRVLFDKVRVAPVVLARNPRSLNAVTPGSDIVAKAMVVSAPFAVEAGAGGGGVRESGGWAARISCLLPPCSTNRIRARAD